MNAVSPCLLTSPVNGNALFDVAPLAGQLIDARIDELSDWRGETLARVRRLIKQVDPEVVEEVKWRKPSNPAGVPVWSHDGMICTGETYKSVVKLTFANGVALEDPQASSMPASRPHQTCHRFP